MAAAGFGVILAPEHMPRLPTLTTIPLEGDLVSREVRLLAVQGRRYSPALDAFVKVARLRDWSSSFAQREIVECVVPVPPREIQPQITQHAAVRRRFRTVAT